VVFSDVMMPGRMNGLDLAREIRRRRPDLPVVLTTGYNAGAAADVREGIPVLRKPYRLDELAQVLGGAVSAAARPQAQLSS
jgi:CheY-like chemotaxis protein